MHPVLGGLGEQLPTLLNMHTQFKEGFSFQ